MACPDCGCKTTYLYDEGDDMPGGDERLYRCAACGAVFDIEDEAPEEDDEPNCDRSACGDYSPGKCDHPDCPALVPPNAMYTLNPAK